MTRDTPSPPREAPGGLLLDGQAASRRIDGGGARVPWSSTAVWVAARVWGKEPARGSGALYIARGGGLGVRAHGQERARAQDAAWLGSGSS
jgi:hypothetical protein